MVNFSTDYQFAAQISQKEIRDEITSTDQSTNVASKIGRVNRVGDGMLSPRSDHGRKNVPTRTRPHRSKRPNGVRVILQDNGDPLTRLPWPPTSEGFADGFD